MVLGALTQNRADTLELTDAELDRLGANAVRIGRKDASGTGDISIEGAVSMVSPTLHIISGAAVTQTAGITAKNLAIESAGNITLNRNDNTVAGRLALRADVGHIDFVSQAAFDITKVDMVNGVGAGGNVRLVANAMGTDKDVTVFNTGAKMDLVAAGSINVSVTGDDATFIVKSGAVIKSTSAATDIVHTFEADEIDLQGTLTARKHRVILHAAHANDAVVLGGTSNNTTAQTFELSNDELNNILATTVQVGRADSTGNLTVSGLVNAGDNPTLSLQTGGDVIATNGQLVVTNLAITAGGSATLTGNNDIGTLAANVGTRRVASLRVADGYNLTLGPVDGLRGVTATEWINACAPGLVAVTGAVTSPFGVSLTAIDRTRADQLQVAATGSITSAGAIVLTAGDQLSVKAGGRVISDRAGVTLTSGAADARAAALCGICIDGTVSAFDTVSVTETTDNLKVTGSVSGNNGVTINLAGDDRTVTVGTNGTITSKAAILINADDLELLAPRSLTAAAITLRPFEASDAVILGASTNNLADTLELTDAELDHITATTLTIGRNDGSAANSLHVAQLSLDPTKVLNLDLKAKGDITQSSGLQVRHLAVEAGGNIDLPSIDNLITGAVAMKATTGSINLQNNTGFEIGTADGVTGLSAGGDVTVLAHGLASAHDLRVSNTTADADISAGGKLDITLTGTDGNFVLLPGAKIRSTANSSSRLEHRFIADDFDLSGVIETLGHTVTLANSSNGQKIALGNVTNNLPLTMELSATEIDHIGAATLRIGRNDIGSASGAITLATEIAPLTATTLHLFTGAGIDGTRGSIQVAKLAVTADGAVSLTANANKVGEFAGEVRTKQALRFNNVQPLAIGTVDGVIGATSLGDVSVTSTGSLTVLNDVKSQSGNVGLTADRGSILITAPTTAPAGQTVLTVRGNGVVTSAFNVSPFTITATAAVGPKVVLVGTNKLLTSPTARLEVAGSAPKTKITESLDEATIAAATQSAINAWAAAGLSGADLAKLQKVKVSVRDLNASGKNPNLLGAAVSEEQIVLDDNAAGRGWSTKSNGAVTSNRVDLISAIAHELGHVLGLHHSPAATDVMADQLTVGERHLPSADDLAAIDALFATDDPATL